MDRATITAGADPVVVKVGTRVLTNQQGVLDEDRITGLAAQLVSVADAGRRVALVSSGSVGAGIGRLGLRERPAGLAELQAAAAVGQSRLIELYNRSLEARGRHAAQILLTADDLNSRDRYLNIRNTLHELFRLGAVPIVNENDTVRVDELQQNVGDNDRLAALVTNLIPARLLILLTDIEGLYDGNPAAAGSKVIPLVKQIDQSVLDLAEAKDETAIKLSTGGMASKLHAALTATTAGGAVVVADGRAPDIVPRILAGEAVGTLFLPQGERLSERKRWIGWGVRPAGTLRLDAGAARAIESGGSSLLPVGVVGADGSFAKGDVVSLVGPDGEEIARGLSNYARSEVEQIRGRSTVEIAGILGRRPYAELVHRDNLALVNAATAR
ncbi:MAG: glutamate 5-kinase [Planctomycetota bacterium]